jgi:hypothetical protein
MSGIMPPLPIRFHGVVLNLKKAQGQLYLYLYRGTNNLTTKIAEQANETTKHG